MAQSKRPPTAAETKPKKPPAFRPMDDAEMERILTAIARAGSNEAARISAIRQLRLMRDGLDLVPAAPAKGEEPLTFEQLDELAMRRAGGRGR